MVLTDGKCIHGHTPRVLPANSPGWAGPAMNCECCGQWCGYIFCNEIGPPIGEHDYCEACSGIGEMVIKNPYPRTERKTLQERLVDFKLAKDNAQSR